jgi:hypothetical protein
MFQEPRECSIGGKNRKFNAMKERSAVRMEKEVRRKEKFKESLVVKRFLRDPVMLFFECIP